VLTPEPPIKTKNHNACDTVDGVDIDELSQKIEMIVPGLEIIRGQGSFVFLNNPNGYFCPFCDRVHENENPYVLIKEDGGIYFSCRRNPRYQLCYLGVLEKFVKPQSELLPSAAAETTGETPAGVCGFTNVSPSDVAVVQATLSKDDEAIMPRMRRKKDTSNDISSMIRRGYPETKTSNKISSLYSKSGASNTIETVPVRGRMSVKKDASNILPSEPVPSSKSDSMSQMPRIGKTMSRKSEKRFKKDVLRRIDQELYKREEQNIVQTNEILKDVYNSSKKEECAKIDLFLVEAISGRNSVKSRNSKDRSGNNAANNNNGGGNNSRPAAIVNYMKLPENTTTKSKEYDSLMSLHMARRT
jgi:hypothetical protein